jgi:hypothetical protein
MELIWPSAFVVQSIHVVARLGLADILGPEPRTIDELAKATRVHAPSLKRVLRALTTVGVFCRGRRWAPSTYGVERDTADGPSGVCPRVGANARRALCVAPAR